MKIGNNLHVVLKRKDVSEPLIYMVSFENYYDKFMEAHIQSGHGGRDRMHYYGKKKWAVSIKASAIFASLCKVCIRKKQPQKRE